MRFGNDILAGLKLIRDAIRSPNYDPGVAGWSINRDGTAEFNNIVARGEIEASKLIAQAPSGDSSIVIDPQEFENLTNPSIEFVDPDHIADGRIGHLTDPGNDQAFLSLFPANLGGVERGALTLIKTATSNTLQYGTQAVDPNFQALIFGWLILDHNNSNQKHLILRRGPSDAFAITVDDNVFITGAQAMHFTQAGVQIGRLNTDGLRVEAMQPVELENATNEVVNSASYTFPTNGVGFTFTAPPSGRVRVDLYDKLVIQPSSNVSRDILSSFEMREGNTVGSGSVVESASDNNAVSTHSELSTFSAKVSASVHKHVAGLTSGDVYNVRTMVRITATTNIANAQTQHRRLTVTPTL